jgi:hypothetical protein
VAEALYRAGADAGAALSGSEDGTARVWNARTGELVKAILHAPAR